MDGGPKPVAQLTLTTAANPTQIVQAPQVVVIITKEEEARQAIEMLHGDDVSERVAAASRLDAVAAALGPVRTREVRIK